MIFGAWLCLLAPLAGALAITLLGERISRQTAAWLSTGFAASALLGFVLGFTQASTNGDDEAYMDLLLGSNTVMEEFL